MATKPGKIKEVRLVRGASLPREKRFIRNRKCLKTKSTVRRGGP